MPSYNTGQFMSDSINSVLSQTYQNWELIIIDDCSTDNSIEIIKSYKDPRIKLLRNEKNSGAAISRNYGLREAKGRYIAFLDSDDIWLPNKLDEQITFMKNNTYVFTYCDYMIVKNGILDKFLYFGPAVLTKRKILVERFLQETEQERKDKVVC